MGAVFEFTLCVVDCCKQILKKSTEKNIREIKKFSKTLVMPTVYVMPYPYLQDLVFILHSLLQIFLDPSVSCRGHPRLSFDISCDFFGRVQMWPEEKGSD